MDWKALNHRTKFAGATRDFEALRPLLKALESTVGAPGNAVFRGRFLCSFRGKDRPCALVRDEEIG